METGMCEENKIVKTVKKELHKGTKFVRMISYGSNLHFELE